MKPDPQAVPNYVIWLFFGLGLVTAAAFRAIIIIDRVEPAWVRPLWYFAVAGNFLFFLYRFKIAKKRIKAIEDFGLIQKIEAGGQLSKSERDAVVYILTSIKVSPERYNYIIISALSVMAILFDLILMFIH